MIVHPVSTSHNHDGVYAPIGSTGSVTVQDEGTPLTARGTINFTGDGVSAADDAVNERTNVTISGGGVTDHGALTGLADDDHTQYVKHSLATAVSDFLVASGAGAFVKKTLAEVKAILGLGSAAYTESTDYLAAGGKAADSDKLDNHDTSYFATADHNHSGVYPGVDGWIPVSSTWSYASATTITVPSGAAAIYKVGQGFRLTANGVVKQGYIVGVADTLLTTTGNALTDHTFSAISYTNTPQTAIGFPDVFSYTVTPTYAGGNTDPTGWTAIVGTYAISGKKATLWIYGQLNRGTGNRTYIKFNLPIVYSTATSANCTHTLLSSTFAAGVVYMSANELVLSLGAAMANSGYLWISATYLI